MLETIGQTQAERLFFIEFRLYFLGLLKRADLTTRFGIKEAAATRDIALYKAEAPGNIDYDSSGKSYRLGVNFKPLFEYQPLQVLAALSQGFGDDYIGNAKPLILCETPIQLNQPDLSTIATISRAIAQQGLIRINYCSHSSGKTNRIIAPFALIDNGVRWHVRAYDRRRNRFTDFVMTRITCTSEVSGTLEEHEHKEQDIQWNRIVPLELVPHPNLNHPETTVLDFGMKDGLLEVNVRAALAGYVLNRWNVDCSENHCMDPSLHHLWLSNRPALYGVDSVGLAPGYHPEEANTKYRSGL